MKPNTRIALVTHHVARGDGQSRVNYELARHLLSRGHAVTLVAVRAAQDLLDLGARHVPIDPWLEKPKLPMVWEFARRANRAVDRLRPEVDLVIANGFSLTRPHDVNVCHFVHGAWMRSPSHVSRLRPGPYGWYQGLYTAANARWEKTAYAAATRVVAVSQKVRTELAGIGVAPSKVRVVPNGVDLAEFHPGTVTRSAAGLPEGVPLALFVGDIRTPRKNLDTILRALALEPQLHLAVVGDTTRSPYPALAESLGLSGRVRFLGFRTDVARVMRACDFFVFPSRYEACTLVLLEAMASGLPVLTARTAGGSELVGADCGEVLEDAESAPALAAAMGRLARDGELRSRMAIAARATAEQHGWAAMAEAYVEVFEEAAAMRERERLNAEAQRTPSMEEVVVAGG